MKQTFIAGISNNNNNNKTKNFISKTNILKTHAGFDEYALFLIQSILIFHFAYQITD